MRVSIKIDFVIPWVDGSDPKWIEERNKYGEEKIITSQYRDWDILKYWFRGIEEFAPWVNKIYFITWGHIPSFLNTKHPKLVIVKHEDYIPKEYLPTFSSHVIETNLHRIKGLSEHFVYFNDDVFITRKVEPRDFFKKGIPVDTAIMKPIEPARYDSISSMMVNNVSLINENFKKKSSFRKNITKWINWRYYHLILLNFFFIPWPRFIGFYEQHLSNAYLKSTFEEVWEKEYDVLNLTGMNRIRNFKVDVNQWLFKNWRIAKGEFYPRSLLFGKYIMVDSIDKAHKASDVLKKKKYKIVCINDHYKGEFMDEIIKIIKEGFDFILEKKSNFEK